ncbi:MAG: site-specific DNA-methyltransferase [Brevinema sp.]
MISLLKLDQSVVLDFPDKQKVFFEDNSSAKADTCTIDLQSAQEMLFSPKIFSDWRHVSSTKKSTLKQLAFSDNFLFKGNNLIVLHSILPIFRNSVKLIYIDPPYNTGNTFVYKDKLSRATWLLFMKNRVEVAKDFLQDDGVIFIQCDENEQAYLKIVCDEIFGEDCFLGSIAVVMNPGGRDYRSMARTHEYLLVYGKTPQAELYPLELDKEFPLQDEIGGFELRNLRNGNIRFHQGNRPNLCYPFYIDPQSADKDGLYQLSLTPKKGWVEVYPRLSQGVQTVWRWGKDKAQQNIGKNTLHSNIVARASKDSFLIFEKYRKKTRLVRTVWQEKDFQTTKGTKHIKAMFGESVFDYPKPELLIARIIDIASQKGDRVMDFFLGSGTTAAVAHKAGRSWIGIEQMDYIDTVTLPRLQNVLKGEEGGASEHYQWQGGGNFVMTSLKTKDSFPFSVDNDNSDPLTNQFYQLKTPSN